MIKNKIRSSVFVTVVCSVELLLDEEVLHPYNESKNKVVTNNKNIFFKLISPKFIYQLQALTKIL